MDVDELTAPDVMTHLNKEVARLTALLGAEREDNRRLAAACSLYRSAACRGLTIAKTVVESDCDRDVAADAMTGMVSDCERADGIAIPLAGE